jgi:hypothetical protein
VGRHGLASLRFRGDVSYGIPGKFVGNAIGIAREIIADPVHRCVTASSEGII